MASYYRLIDIDISLGPVLDYLPPVRPSVASSSAIRSVSARAAHAFGHSCSRSTMLSRAVSTAIGRRALHRAGAAALLVEPSVPAVPRQCRVPGAAGATATSACCVTAGHGRFFSSSSGGGKGGDGGEDPFGVNYNDEATGGLGPDKPPSLIRDATTGKLTGEVESELTDEERRLLSMTQADKAKLLQERFVASWNEEGGDGEDGVSGNSREAEIAERIRTEQMALNVIGRSAADVASSQEAEHSGGGGDDDANFTAPLSPSEFQTFRKYVEKEHGVDDISEEDIPVSRAASGSDATTSSQTDPDLDLTWLTSAARAEVEGPSADDIMNDPFIDLMPSDLNPARKVNRKRAKPLPKELLHHNNLSLLRRFVTPGGQIMNRVRSRLGAKDQRKIAKLIKRARHLGLIPHLGQWKLEDHGNIHAKDIRMEKDWEKELVDRGLLEKK